MVFKLFIDKDCREEVVANVHRRTALVDEIERLCREDDRPDQMPMDKVRIFTVFFFAGFAVIWFLIYASIN